MDTLKEKFIAKAAPMKEEVKSIIKEHGDKKLGEYTVASVYQGMKGMIGLVTETSKLDPEEGIRFRGYTIPELREQLPKAPNGTEPLPEGIFYLMLVGELPTKEEAYDISNHWARRSIVPKHVFDVLDKLPANTHPMTMFSTAVMAMQTESLFAAAYKKGISKKQYWDYTYEDAMNLIARLPRVAAYIYRKKYKNDGL
jgi:citrate synthase